MPCRSSAATESMSLLYNLHPASQKKLDELKPTLGYCILVDLSNSTELKNEPLKVWTHRIFNTFLLVRNGLGGIRPLKAMGDELMFYVLETLLDSRHYTAIDLFLALAILVQEDNKTVFRPTKAAITYCQDAYDLTFIRDTQDIYGKDIDLTARLRSNAREGELLMNGPFIEKLRTAHEERTGLDDFLEKAGIGSFVPEPPYKGFPNDLMAYRFPRRTSADDVLRINKLVCLHHHSKMDLRTHD